MTYSKRKCSDSLFQGSRRLQRFEHFPKAQKEKVERPWFISLRSIEPLGMSRMTIFLQCQKIQRMLSAHTSKETMKCLLTKGNCFEFSFTPKHGSCLNLIETFFGKMTRSFLRRIHVSFKDDLVSRIYSYIDIVNKYPVVHKWTYFMDSFDLPTT